MPSSTYNREAATGSSEALLLRAQQGDERAFEELIQLLEKPLFNYLRRMCGNTADAEDLFQETFLRVYQKLDSYSARYPGNPWIYRIATNLCIDLFRKRKRQRMFSLEALLGNKRGGLALRDTLPAPGPGPDRQSELAELSTRLESAVMQLPPKQRAVFVMARYDNMAYDDISKALDIPVGTVKSRMNKAVQALIGRLEGGEL